MRKRPWMSFVLTLVCAAVMTFGLTTNAVAAPPAAPSNLHQTGIESTSVKMAWTDNFSGEDGFEIYRAPEGTYTWTLVGVVGENVTEFKDLGLSPDTNYSYVVTCYSGATASDYSNQISVHTPVVAPAAPSGLTAALTLGPAVDLIWVDNSSNEVSFRIERSTGGGPYSTIAGIAEGATHYVDSTVVVGNTYCYRVQSRTEALDSEWSNIATITVSSASVEVPTGLAATYNGRYVGLIWNDVATEDRYQIDRSLGADPPSILAETGTNVYFYHDSTVTPGNTYQYRVRIGSGSIFGEWTPPVSITIPGVTAVVPPGGLTAAANSAGNAIVLSWTDNSTNETQFQVNRRVPGEVEINLGTVPANITTYTDTTAVPGVIYRYRVRGIGASIELGSAWTDEVAASLTTVPVVTLLAAPSNLAASNSGSSINLTWRDNSSNESAFILERKSSTGSYAELATLSPNAVSYSDLTAPGGTGIAYRLRAYNSAGYSSYSNEFSISIAAVGPPIASSTQKIIRLYINKTEYYVNDELLAMDSAPIIKQGRTLLPIRYVATPLGATVEWDAATKKVTVKLNGTVIELWIGKNKARVNGIEKPIDPDNSTVSSVVVPPGRTMLPLRFIAENLGCQVIWNQALNEVKVVYPKTTN